MKITNNINLSKYSTMRVGGVAKYFTTIKLKDEILEIMSFIKENNLKHITIGEGSNTIFKGDFDGIVIKNEIKGIEKVKEDNNSITLKVGGGENWHDFVEYCVDNNFAGNENLAFIPGTIGAAPVQNIAAYGQVQEDTFHSLEAINLNSGELKIFSKEDCKFAYRSSIFKQNLKNQFFISSVTYKLKKATKYIPETSYYSRYESLDQFLPEEKSELTLKDIFNAIIKLRKHKLPQVEEVGTVGSFFVNPFVTKEHLEKLKIQFPGIQYYPVDKMQYPELDSDIFKNSEIFKIPAGWLIEERGWRGKFIGNVGCSEKHALCIIVKGPAAAEDVINFMNTVKSDIYEASGITLETEVNLV